MSNKNPFIRIDNISKHYPGVEALKAVSFDIAKGTVHALVGENGAGKSTVIKILSGAVQADPGGCLYLNGDPYLPHNPKEAIDKGVATIYQIMNLCPDRTIMDNIMLGREPARNGIIDYSMMRTRTLQLLETLQAGYLNPDALVGSLKVGEKQVVEIAKAMVHESKFLIMDEATSALNHIEMEALFSNIRTLRERGVTVLYVSHRLDEIYNLADDVSVLRDGRHIFTGKVKDVKRDELIYYMIGRKVSNIYPDKVSKAGEKALEVKNLCVNGILRDINLTLRRGEVLAVTGLSGCGKADLGKAIYGALPTSSGSVLTYGKPFKPSPSNSIRSGLILLPEDRKEESMLQELNIRRNISLSVLKRRTANILGIIHPKKEQAVALEQVIALDIKASGLEQIVKYLSGGNQQKVALGRCLAVEPDIYLLLEPTQGIDVGVKFEIYKFINEHAARGKAILLISSELAEVMGLAQRILVMFEGKIVADLESKKTSQEEIMQFAIGDRVQEKFKEYIQYTGAKHESGI